MFRRKKSIEEEVGKVERGTREADGVAFGLMIT